MVNVPPFKVTGSVPAKTDAAPVIKLPLALIVSPPVKVLAVELKVSEPVLSAPPNAIAVFEPEPSIMGRLKVFVTPVAWLIVSVLVPLVALFITSPVAPLALDKPAIVWFVLFKSKLGPWPGVVGEPIVIMEFGDKLLFPLHCTTAPVFVAR